MHALARRGQQRINIQPLLGRLIVEVELHLPGEARRNDAVMEGRALFGTRAVVQLESFTDDGQALGHA